MKLSAYIQTQSNGSRLAPPLDVEGVQQLIIRDELGQPMMILIQQAPDRIWLSKQGDSDFDKALGYLGIRATPMQVTKTDALRDIQFPAVSR